MTTTANQHRAGHRAPCWSRSPAASPDKGCSRRSGTGTRQYPAVGTIRPRRSPCPRELAGGDPHVRRGHWSTSEWSC